MQQIITPYAPVGDTATRLSEAKRVLRPLVISLVQNMASYDRLIWPHATDGFFRFKDKIPSFIDQIRAVESIA